MRVHGSFTGLGGWGEERLIDMSDMNPKIEAHFTELCRAKDGGCDGPNERGRICEYHAFYAVFWEYRTDKWTDEQLRNFRCEE